MRSHLIFLFLFFSLLTKETFLRAQGLPSFTLAGLSAQKVPVTFHKMTSLVFPMAIRTGVKVSRDVLVQKVKGVDNVIELKAMRPRFMPTNLSVFGMDGRLYSFDLEYEEGAPVLNFAVLPSPGTAASGNYAEKVPILLTGLPTDQATLAQDAETLAPQEGFLHQSARSEKMRLVVKGIYLRDSLLWFVICLRNHSQIPYHPAYLRLFSLDRKKVNRMAIQQAAMEPVYRDLPERIEGRATCSFALGFPLFTLARDKKLILEVAERNGGRLLSLPITCKTLLKARSF